MLHVIAFIYAKFNAILFAKSKVNGKTSLLMCLPDLETSNANLVSTLQRFFI